MHMVKKEECRFGSSQDRIVQESSNLSSRRMAESRNSQMGNKYSSHNLYYNYKGPLDTELQVLKYLVLCNSMETLIPPSASHSDSCSNRLGTRSR
jgi:hypothetical protein